MPADEMFLVNFQKWEPQIPIWEGAQSLPKPHAFDMDLFSVTFLGPDAACIHVLRVLRGRSYLMNLCCNKKLRYLRGTARRTMSIEILSTAAKLYEKSHLKGLQLGRTLKVTRSHRNCLYSIGHKITSY